MMMRLDDMTRVEIIGPGGREYVTYVEPGIRLVVQDEGRTLKVFHGGQAAA